MAQQHLTSAARIAEAYHRGRPKFLGRYTSKRATNRSKYMPAGPGCNVVGKR